MNTIISSTKTCINGEEVSITIHCQRHFAESDATVQVYYAIMTTMEQMQELCCVPYIKWNWRRIRIVAQGQPLAQTVIFLERENNRTTVIGWLYSLWQMNVIQWVEVLLICGNSINCYSNFNRRIQVWTHARDIQCFVGDRPYSFQQSITLLK